METKMKTAKIFQNGQYQAVWLPSEFKFKDDCVSIKNRERSILFISWIR